MDNYNTNLTAEAPDANVNELPVHNTMQSGDRLLGSGTAEEFLVDYELLADAILNKLTTKEYAGLGTAAKNIPAAIKELAQGKIPVTFTKATTRSEILSTEKLPTLFGKISKWLSDLGAAAFCKVANNDTTTAGGYVADARAVEKLGKEVDALNSSSVKVRTVNSWTMIEYPNNLVEMWRYATISSAANAKTNTLSLATPMKDSQYGVKISPVFNGHLCKSVWAGTKTGADGRTETTVQISMDSTDSDSNVGVFVFVTGYRAA